MLQQAVLNILIITFSSYNSGDVIFLKAKVMVTKGFSKTTLLMVIISLETWNYTAAELQDICACLFILLVVIFNQGPKRAEQAGNFVTHLSHPLCVDKS